MRTNGVSSFLRFAVYFLELYVFYCLEQSSLLGINVLNAHPFFVVSVFVSVSIWEKEYMGMIFGIVCGAFLDVAFGIPVGICSLMFSLLGYILGVLSKYFIRSDFWSVWLLSVVINTLVAALRFCFSFIIPGYDDAWFAWNKMFVPSLIYAAIASPLIFLLNRSICYFMRGNSGGEQNKFKSF